MADRSGREESGKERADRRYEELLQELRIAQAGVQILFAFLLVLLAMVGYRWIVPRLASKMPTDRRGQ